MLPVKNFLQGGGGWIALGKHGNDDVSGKRLSSGDLVADLESDFRRHSVVGLEESMKAIKHQNTQASRASLM